MPFSALVHWWVTPSKQWTNGSSPNCQIELKWQQKDEWETCWTPGFTSQSLFQPSQRTRDERVTRNCCPSVKKCEVKMKMRKQQSLVWKMMPKIVKSEMKWKKRGVRMTQMKWGMWVKKMTWSDEWRWFKWNLVIQWTKRMSQMRGKYVNGWDEMKTWECELWNEWKNICKNVCWPWDILSHLYLLILLYLFFFYSFLHSKVQKLQ